MKVEHKVVDHHQTHQTGVVDIVGTRMVLE